MLAAPTAVTRNSWTSRFAIPRANGTSIIWGASNHEKPATRPYTSARQDLQIGDEVRTLAKTATQEEVSRNVIERQQHSQPHQ
jgi:hypothetical protein